MAQTKKRRRSKHRGTPAGTIEARGRTGRKPTADERKTSTPARSQRLDRKPTWSAATTRAGLAAALLVVVSITLLKAKPGAAVAMAIVAFALYIPIGYYFDRYMYNRRLRQKAQAGKPKGE